MNTKTASVGVERFLRRAAVESATGLPRSTIYDMIADGRFPKPVKIGPKVAAWRESEIIAWQQARIAERDTAA